MMDFLLKPHGFGYRSTAEDVSAGVDLSGKIAIVTGANVGPYILTQRHNALLTILAVLHKPLFPNFET